MMRAILCTLAVLALPLVAGGCEGFNLGFSFGSDPAEHYEMTETWDGRNTEPPTKRKPVAPY